MSIVTINFASIKADRAGNVNGKININNNVMFTEVKAIDINLGSGQQPGLLLKFKYVCQYEPKIGSITLEGDVVAMEKQEIVKEAAAAWEKNKKIDPDLSRTVLGQVLTRCSVQAIILSRDLGLPAPVPLPKIEAPAKATDAKDAEPSKKNTDTAKDKK